MENQISGSIVCYLRMKIPSGEVYMTAILWKTMSMRECCFTHSHSFPQKAIRKEGSHFAVKRELPPVEGTFRTLSRNTANGN